MLNVVPDVHVAGRLASVPDELVSEPAVTAARSRNFRVPVVPSTAIQYVVPAVTPAPVTTTVLLAPATGAVIVPVVSSVPGWLVALFV